MKFLSVLMLIALFAPAAHAAEADCADERCDTYRHGALTGLKPAVPHMVCFVAQRDKPDVVILTLYANRLNGRIVRQLKRYQGKKVRFCVGSQWVRKSTAVDLCNGVAESTRGPKDLAEGLHTGIVRMCLYGDQRCAEFRR